MNRDKAWELSKELAGLIELPETQTLQGEEREVYDVMVAQDFYNLYCAYNERYKSKRYSAKLSKILNELENGLHESQKERLNNGD